MVDECDDAAEEDDAERADGAKVELPREDAAPVLPVERGAAGGVIVRGSAVTRAVAGGAADGGEVAPATRMVGVTVGRSAVFTGADGGGWLVFTKRCSRGS